MRNRTETFVLGLDGGGTGTRAVLVDGDGLVRGEGFAGPSNIHVVGRDATRDAIATAVREACVAAAIDITSIVSAFLGLAGVAAQRDRDDVAAIVGEVGLASGVALGIDHDLRIALAGGLAGTPGIVLIAGTGSSCYGRTDDGTSWRSGGWGPLIDDVGGGYWLGVEALAAIARAIDGRGVATELEERLAEALGLADTDELLRLTGRVGLSRDRIAALAPEILDASRNRDAVAAEIVHRGIDGLARMVDAVATRLEWDAAEIPLVLAGGLTKDTRYRTAILKAIAARTPRIIPRPSQMSPVRGAAILALEAIGAAAPTIIARLSD
jgi:glucosamine kinase